MSRHRRAAPSITRPRPPRPGGAGRRGSPPPPPPRPAARPRRRTASSVTVAQRIPGSMASTGATRAPRPRLDEVERQPVGTARRHEDDVRHVGPRHPLLHAGEPSAPPGRLGPRPGRLGPPVEIGVEQRDGRPHVPRGDGRQPPGLLGRAPRRLDRPGRHDRLEVRAREHHAPHLLQDDGCLDHAEAAPAVRLRQGEAEPAERASSFQRSSRSPRGSLHSARTTAGVTRSSRKARAVPRRSCWSSLNAKSTAPPRPGPGRPALPSAARARARR